ncbi:rho guanine nucleotide exchange factor 10-like protein isoform X2 [Biomphalaria glabrata]|uniref:Rho guanine nucleotide exchange factor 10-like protein isoform X2 n=1 Tax=Biomphalaria glabrata TaxID=6526 RepID=A0A9W2YL59_BIOGL|nr:rho guanine nucleotide exchange factor 10-like protein isoform X2 [Biomphalaria glabrata]
MSKPNCDCQQNDSTAQEYPVEINPFELEDCESQPKRGDHLYFELEKDGSSLIKDTMETDSTVTKEKQGKKKGKKTDRKKRNSIIQSLIEVLNKDKSSEGKSEGKVNSKSVSEDITEIKHSDKKSGKKVSITEDVSQAEDNFSLLRGKCKNEFDSNVGPIYDLASELEIQPNQKPPKKLSPKWGEKKTDSLRSSVSVGNRGCQEGFGSPNVSIASNSEMGEYSLAFLRSTESQLSDSDIEKLKAKGFENLNTGNNSTDQPDGHYDEADDEYCCPTESEGEGENFDWGSEFEDEDDNVYHDPETPDDKEESVYEKPLPKPPKNKVANKVPSGLNFLNRKSSTVVESVKPSTEEILMTTCLPVTINPDKHPPPFLPPEPVYLSENQKKRRMIISLIIQSEQSYLEALERILKDYEKTVLDFIPNSKSKLKHVFAQTRDIVSHHKMFQIELSEIARKWDEEEKIGDTFTASFSKSMLVDSYSMYVNNFAAAMEEIRTLRRQKASFDELLKNQEKLGPDRLSIFGLMVKPVQRFPQFMMFIQDLIKYTPQNHPDRRALQLALTELENVAYKLNERKRQSEQEFQAHQIVHKLVKQKVQHLLTANFNHDARRRALRSDLMEQICGEVGNLKCKNRRIILMNDKLLCVKVLEKEQSGFVVERLALRWFANLSDIELKDTAITPEMLSVVKKDSDKIDIISTRLDQYLEHPEEDPYHIYADLKDMLHDYNILGQISGLLASLKRSYVGHGLNEELIHEVSRDLQRMIQLKDEQLRLVNSCSIVLEDTSKTDKPHYVLQTQSASLKQEWCVDFLMAKLAVDKSNMPAWDSSLSSDVVYDSIPAVFMRHLAVDVPRTYTQIKCAVSIFLNPENSSVGVGVQHLWVCASNDKLGQISLLSIHNSKPSLMESFKACSCEITAVELVPGCGSCSVLGSYLFAEDTVWMSTVMNEILIFPLTNIDGAHRQVIATIKLPSTAISLKFVDERFFCGLDSGVVLIFSRSEAGNWDILTPAVFHFGTSQVKFHFVHEEDLYLSCENQLFLMEIDSLQQKARHVLMTENKSDIDTVVKSGVGIWVSFKESAVIKLFHIESMENLQELSVGNFVNRIRSERLWSLSGATENLVVTCLAISRGLLWIGTSTGLILTVPLPRLSDGVPLYRGKPNISLHAHKGSVRFLLSLNCSTSTMELNSASSLRAVLRTRSSRRNLERERAEENAQREPSMPEDAEPSASTKPSPPKATDEMNDFSKVGLKRTLSNQSRPLNLLTDAEAEAIKEWEELNSSEDKKTTRSSKLNQKTSFEESLSTLKRSSYSLKKGEKRLSAGSVVSEKMDLSEQNLPSLEKPHEVEMLYEVLMEEGMGRAEEHESPEASSAATGSEQALKRHSESTAGDHVSLLSPDSSLPSSKTVTLSPSSSTSSTNSSKETTDLGTSGMKRGTSLKRTLSRKVSNNAVIVLSGGDGCCDLDCSRSQSKTDCASVMLWIYKY